MAIQLIINRELGLAHNENPLQGSHLVEWLTDRGRGGGARRSSSASTSVAACWARWSCMYQRSKIQEEILKYEQLKHDGDLPIIGVNTFQNPDRGAAAEASSLALSRSSGAEKDDQIRRLRAFQAAHAGEDEAALARLKAVALAGGNIFEELMETVRCCSLGQISRALFEVGGEYRRSM
jgi:methylmalonyl-CoA mutase